MIWLIAPLALLLERLVGYPKWVFDRIGHPVTWMGAQISWLDRALNGGSHRRTKGLLALAVLVVTVLAASLPLTIILRNLPFGWAGEAFIATTCLAQKELARAVRAVTNALRSGIATARAAVGEIVGRDTAYLDEAGISRAAVETLAESTSDGVVAPLFWLLIAGLPGALVYKAVNTADSMIGHRTERYSEFGWASARFDDVLNWVPARLTAVLVGLAALLTPGLSAAEAWSVSIRDAPKHDSPNAGWPEAAFAGALGLSLGGPRRYGGEIHDLPTFGSGNAELDARSINEALRLYGATLNLLLLIVVAGAGVALLVTRQGAPL